MICDTLFFSQWATIVSGLLGIYNCPAGSSWAPLLQSNVMLKWNEKNIPTIRIQLTANNIFHLHPSLNPSCHAGKEREGVGHRPQVGWSALYWMITGLLYQVIGDAPQRPKSRLLWSWSKWREKAEIQEGHVPLRRTGLTPGVTVGWEGAGGVRGGGWWPGGQGVAGLRRFYRPERMSRW